MKTKTLTFLSLLALAAVSCKKDKTTPIECGEIISYAADVQPIIMNSCATTGCHSGPNASNNMNFVTYEGVFEHRILIGRSVRHESGVIPMPFGPQLSADKIRKISCWIEQGAPNN
jgi:hypothetical protein